MNIKFLASTGIFAVSAVLLFGILQRDEEPFSSGVEQIEVGEALFNSNCAKCHGSGAIGTDVGPPLVHVIYEPNHHADYSFHRAVAQGVRQHHWRYGDMPAIGDVSGDQVNAIVAYVRSVQDAAGIR